MQVRGLTIEQLAESLSRQLGTPGKHYQEVLGSLATRQPPLIVIDGLDEAGDDAIAKDFLAPLGRYARVLIATRTVPEPLIGLTIELDNSPVHDYVLARLAGVPVDAEAVAAAIDGPFLLARLITSQLMAQPGVIDDLPSTIEEAFRRDLGDDARAVDLLTALAYSYGTGFPLGVWTAVAHRTREDAVAVLAEYGRYVTTSSLDGQAVYRLHQGIADVLRGDAAVWPEVLACEGEDPYLARYRWRHAADGGYAGIEALTDRASVGYAWRELSSRLERAGRDVEALDPAERALAAFEELDDPAEIATALIDVGTCLAAVGRRAEAVAPVERAVAIREQLGNASSLADALNSLAVRYGDAGRHGEAIAPAERAVALHGENKWNLAQALNTLGAAYGARGRYEDALAATERAAGLFGEVAATQPAALADFAAALMNLGIGYHRVGRPADAIAPSERAVAAYELLAAQTPGLRDELATVMTNLGGFYAAVGRSAEAIAQLERAAALGEELAAGNPGRRGSLAATLGNLGNLYATTGRWQEALAATERAVAHYEELSESDAALATALNNLSARYGELGRLAEAVAPIERAVAIRERLADENPAYLDVLAGSLNNLGVVYAAVGRRVEAVTPSERSVAILERLASESPAFRDQLANALTVLALRYRDTARLDAALVPAERAVALRERQADGRLAFALNTAGLLYAELARPEEAIARFERARATLEALPDETPVVRHDLAQTLNNLALSYRETGRYAEAVEQAERAVALFEALIEHNAGVVTSLAGALGTLGLAYRSSGRDGNVALERAVDLAAADPVVLPTLGAALEHLGSDERWTELLTRFAEDPYASTVLHARRGSIDDLVAAARLDPGADPQLTGEIHRRLREADRARVEHAWEGELPAWLTVDEALLEQGADWVQAPTWAQARATLPPQLLTPEGEAAMAEIALRLPAARTRYELIAACRRDGVDVAFRGYLIGEAYLGWRETGEDPPELLLAPDAIALIDDPVDAARLTLAAEEAQGTSLEDARRSGSPAVLHAVAVLGYEDDPARATVHMAMAQVLSGQAQDVLDRLAGDVDVKPLIADVSDAIAHRPEQAAALAALIGVLTA